MPEFALEARGLTKHFRGFTALDKVDLKVRRGGIHGLIGPNGAGKTTCFNLLTKFLQPSAGQIFLNGKEISHDTPAKVARLGMTRSFQISAVFPGLTALENVRISIQRSLRLDFHFWRGPSAVKKLNERCRQYLADVSLEGRADTLAADLVYGEKRALEIATTMAAEPAVMLLDEPTAGLGHEEIEPITALIKRASASRTILLVEHNMKLIAGICDTVTVLQRGTVLAEGSYQQIAAHPLVLEAYLGTSAD